MPIQAQSADGTIHEFPDHTPDAVVDRAMAEYAQQSKPPNSFTDAVRSVPGGLVKGLTGLAGLPGTISDAASSGLDYLANKVTGADIHTAKNPLSGASLEHIAGLPTGGYYQPQTTAGRYAETAASFAPAIAGGSASLGQKLMGRVLAPAAGSQALGSAVDDDSPILKTGAQVLGAVLGGGAVGGGRALREAVTKPPSPDVVANKYLAEILSNTGATPDSIRSAAIKGRGQLGAEALGPQGVAMMATLGRRSGSTAEELANTLSARAANAPTRVMDDFSTAAGIHPEAAQGNIDALVDAGRARVKPLYDEALNSAPAIHTPRLQELMDRPIIKKAMAAAANDLRNGGENPGAIGLHFDEAGNITQRIDPTPAAWDLTKKALGQAVDRDAFGNRLPDSKSPGNFRIGQANAALSDALSEAIPSYGDALKESGDYLSLKSAFDAGQKHILSTTTTAKQVADHVASLSPAELDAYKGGIANEVFNKAQNARLAPRILNTPAVQQKLSAALGPDKAQTFLNGLQQEIDLAKSGGRMMPGTGSITSDVLLNSGEMDHASNLAAALKGGEALGHAASGNLGTAALKGIGAVRTFAPDFLRSGGMNADTRNTLGKLLMLPPEDLAVHVEKLPAAPKRALMAKILGEK